MRRATAPLAAVFLLAAGTATGCGRHTAAPAGTALPSGTRLVVVTDGGLRLRPADGDRVTTDPATRARWSRHGRTRVLDLDCPGHPAAGHPCPREPTVEVPAGTPVSVTARNAGVDVAGLTGPLDLTTVNGDVTAQDSGDPHATVRLTTRNGSVRAHGLRAARIGGTTVNGDVDLDCATAPTAVTAATTNGSVTLTVPSGTPAYRATTATVNGHASITLPTAHPAPGRAITLRTVNGDITAREA